MMKPIFQRLFRPKNTENHEANRSYNDSDAQTWKPEPLSHVARWPSEMLVCAAAGLHLTGAQVSDYLKRFIYRQEFCCWKELHDGKSSADGWKR